MRSTTEHIPLNSGTGRYLYRVTIDIDNMFDTAYGNFTRKKSVRQNRKKKGSGRQKISSKGQLTGILTELPENRNFFPVAGINSGQTGIMAGLPDTGTLSHLQWTSAVTKSKVQSLQFVITVPENLFATAEVSLQPMLL